jgi:hypothetical protein
VRKVIRHDTKSKNKKNRGRSRQRGVNGPRNRNVSQAEVQALVERRKEKVSKEFDDLVTQLETGKYCRPQILGAVEKEALTEAASTKRKSTEALPR